MDKPEQPDATKDSSPTAPLGDMKAASPEMPADLRKKRLTIILFAVGGMLVLGVVIGVLCLAITGVAGFSAVSGFMDATSEIVDTLDQFMRAMEDRDIDQAYDLFLTSEQGSRLRTGLEDWIVGANFALFDGYLNLELGGLNVQASAGIGTVGTVNGIIHYQGGYTGNFDAVLLLEGDQWRLQGINLTVEPEKIQEYLEQNP